MTKVTANMMNNLDAGDVSKPIDEVTAFKDKTNQERKGRK